MANARKTHFENVEIKPNDTYPKLKRRSIFYSSYPDHTQTLKSCNQKLNTRNCQTICLKYCTVSHVGWWQIKLSSARVDWELMNLSGSNNELRIKIHTEVTVL